MNGLRLLTLVFVLAGCTGHPPDDLPFQELDPVAEVIATDLSGVTRVVELPDGRVAMVERFLPALTIVDPVTGTLMRFGRRGPGPGEFQNPGPLLPLYPDTLGVPELLGRRLHLFAADGRFVRTARLPGGPFYVTAMTFGDGRGWIYVVNEGTGRQDLEAPVESIGVMRGRPDDRLADSIWSLGVTPRQAVAQDAGAALMRPVFGDEDVLAVSTSGRVIRASPALQQFVEWVDGDEIPLGTTWGLAQVPVSSAERDSIQTCWEQMPPYRGIRVPFARAKTVSEGLLVAPDGEIWLRLTARSEGRIAYRVFRADGTPRLIAVTGTGTEIVGLGGEFVYLLRQTADELGILLRAPRPSTKGATTG